MKLKDFLKEHKVDEIDLLKVMLCEDCKNVFVWHEGEKFPNDPKRCPSCSDKVQKRPSIVKERTELARFERVEIKSLPASWEIYQTNVSSDFPCYKITKRGNDFGVSWSGRIDIFADAPYGIGNIVTVRVMESKHMVQKLRYHAGHIQKSPFDPPTHLVEKTVEVNTKECGEKQTLTEEVESRQYVALEGIAEVVEPAYSLVWETAHSKTTLKGYGRQYHALLDASATLWHTRCKGGVRSGRQNTEGVLAIVDNNHPLISTFSEGSETTTRYIK